MEGSGEGSSGQEETLAEGDSEPGRGSCAADSEPTQGSVVGRYVVLSRIGAGGMGVVFAAYDPQLDRKVALKLLRVADGRSTTLERDHRRLEKEAQALAKLSHPNVITVHDVGEHEGRVFLAMEFVEGRTLTRWQSEARGWREVLAIYRHAGRGLAAAHERGLVHRDFKPENVMVGADGRVRVMDFGLARTVLHEAEPPSMPGAAPILATAATGFGGLVGTPAYMSPEQFSERPVSARSDQFSFCVALWEALFGERPFAGDDVVSLCVSVQSGVLCEPARGHRVPPWVRRALARGLAVDPSERWESMDDLLRSLTPPSRTRRWVALSIGGVAVAGGVALAIGEGEPGPRCEPPRPVVPGAWEPERRAAVRQALLATELPHAASTWMGVEAGLDAHAAAWSGVRHRLCTAPPEDGLESARTVCLDRRRRALGSLVEVLAAADAAVLERAVESVSRLPDPGRCLEVAYVSAAIEPPADAAVAREVEALRERLARVDALRAAGKVPEAGRALALVAAEAMAVEYEPLRGEVGLSEARLHRDRGAADAAAGGAREAYERLLAVGHDEQAAAAALLVASAVGVGQGRPDEGLAWIPSARALARRAHLGRSFEAQVLLTSGEVQLARGDLDQAQQLLLRSLELREELGGPERVLVAEPALALGQVHTQRGALEEATRFTEQARRIREHALGPEHPAVAGVLRSLGNLHVLRGQLDRARDLYQRSMTLLEEAYGPEHPDIGLVVSNLGIVARNEGDLEQARRYYERALAIAERSSGADHPHAAIALTNLSPILVLQGSYEEARRIAQRSVDIWEGRLGDEPAHANAAAAVHNLANALMQLGRYERAQAQFERAIELWEQAVGAENPAVLDPLVGLADSLIQQERAAEGLAVLARLPRLLERIEPSRLTVLSVRYLELRARGQLEGRYDRDALARLRAELEDAASPELEALRRDVDTWLSTSDASRGRRAARR